MVGKTKKQTNTLLMEPSTPSIKKNPSIKKQGKFATFLNKTKKAAGKVYGNAKAKIEKKYSRFEKRNKVLYSNFLGLYKITYFRQDDRNMYTFVVESKRIEGVAKLFMNMLLTIKYLTEKDYINFFTTDGNSISDEYPNRAYVTEKNLTNAKQIFKEVQNYYDTHHEKRRELRAKYMQDQSPLGRLGSKMGNTYRTAKTGFHTVIQKTKKRIENAMDKVEYKTELDGALHKIRTAMMTEYKKGNKVTATNALLALVDSLNEKLNPTMLPARTSSQLNRKTHGTYMSVGSIIERKPSEYTSVKSENTPTSTHA